MKYAVLVGRIFFALIFVIASLGHFSKTTIDYAASQGVQMAFLFVPLSGIFALVGGVSVAIGFKAKWGAWLLVLFLIPVTFAMHSFWTVSDDAIFRLQQVMFLKNLSMLGGALLIAYFGSGPLSVDSRLASK